MMKKIFEDFIEPILISVVIAFLLINFVFYKVQVVGSSMYPNLENGQTGISFVISKYFGIERFEIVVVKTEQKDIVKRIIGLPGELVEYKDEKLYINGEYVEQSFEFIKDGTEDFSIQLGEDEYFVMGDNRPVSKDSRDIGPVSKDQIVSLHVLVFSPLSKFGFEK